jgi:dTDP-4-dehydrorhamnose reductase
MFDCNHVLITGGSGMVGYHFQKGLKPSSSELDVSDFKSVQNYFSKIQNIQAVIHLASLNLRECELNVQKAITININGTSNILRICKQFNIPLVFLSSGAVFSSKNCNQIFTEDSTTNPNCIYGYTKDAAEKIVLTYEKTILIRTGWLFGGNQKNHYKFVDIVLNYLILNKQIKASNDFYGSHTYVKDLVEKTWELIENKEYGVHHVVNSGVSSGFDISKYICELLNKDSDLIVPISCIKVPNPGPDRSRSEILYSINQSNHLRSWKDALKEYILDMNRNQVFQEEKPIKNYKNRSKCRLCDNKDLITFFKLEPTPPANHFVSQITKLEYLPLDLSICSQCFHIQLLQIVDPKFLYSNYFYVSSVSPTMINHLKNNIDIMISDLNLTKEDVILEIGANDGTCIQHLIDRGFHNVLGIDPAENINKRHNLPILCDFFGKDSLPRIQSMYQKFKLIFGFHCCAHIENIKDVFECVVNLLNDNGTFVMEVGYFIDVFKNMTFDTIYHEHIDYHTCGAIKGFGERFGLFLYRIRRNNIQGGSIQFYFSKSKIEPDIEIEKAIMEEEIFKSIDRLNDWPNLIIKNGIDIKYILEAFGSNNKKIVGYGASAKSTTFLHQYKLNNSLIQYIIDDNIYKQNYFTPGLNIPIKSFQTLFVDNIDYIIILSCNFVDEIINKLEYFRKTGLRIIVPFPQIKII